MRRRVATLALVALAACFERGGKRPAGRDADVAVVAPDADAGAGGGAGTGANATDTGWLAADPTGAVDAAATVTIGLEAEPVSLDPFLAGDAIAARVLGDVYEGLLCVGADDQVQPCLAEHHQPAPDGKSWRFWLRPDLRFHDGRAVKVADVVASLKAPGQGAAAKGPLAAVLDDLVAIETPGPRELVLRFREARASRARDLTLVPIAPADRIAAGDLGRAPVGTGPLRFVAWRRGEAIDLARWDGYRGPPSAAARVRYRVTADRAEALRLLAAGAIDVALQVPIADAIAFTAANPRAARFRYELPAFLTGVYNTRRPALASADVRRGLTALLDRPGIARQVLGGARVLSGPHPPGDPSSDPAVVPVPFDRALAGKLLGDARPTVALLVPQGSTITGQIADIWAADARGLATLNVRAVPYGELLARLAALDFDLALTSMSAGPDMDLWSRLASDAPADQAWPGLSDPALDQLLDAHRRAPTAAARAEAGQAIHRRLDELQPFAFIAVDTRAGLARAGVVGVVGATGATVGPPRARAIGKLR